MSDKKAMRELIYGVARTTQIGVRKKTDHPADILYPRTYNLVHVHGNRDPLPFMFNAVTFNQGAVTVFNVQGELFAGNDSWFTLNVYKYPNGVVNAEITAYAPAKQATITSETSEKAAATG